MEELHNSYLEKPERIPPGSYRAFAYFKKRPTDREPDAFTEQPICEEEIIIDASTDLSKIREKINSSLQALGLHNMGMNCLSSTYPNGHPVYVRLVNDSDIVVGYVQYFNANGFTVENEGNTDLELIPPDEYVPNDS